MYKPKPGVDIIAKVLDALYAHNPDALFVLSLMHQYEERGSLSKKQLEGLLSKAKKVADFPVNWLGTLEAIILKMPTRYKSEEPLVAKPIYQKDDLIGKMLDAILEKYPTHKRALFLKTKFSHHEIINPDEISEIKKFLKLLKITFDEGSH